MTLNNKEKKVLYFPKEIKYRRYCDIMYEYMKSSDLEKEGDNHDRQQEEKGRGQYASQNEREQSAREVAERNRDR